jgi:Ca2+-transporting ATPase
VLVTTALQLALLYVPPLQNFFGTVPLSLHDLGICVAVSLVFFVYLEMEKIWRLWRRRAHADA